ncbi:PilZ domain-containing protein [Pseudoduganella sp. SL102]|uniref:PilZ domain-containing protein n=1 Tax=Pseudoduganella sp. SL102 TaxID=2995154 RepID=UPI00248B7A63|nr:PilZ domain-containing protein [Pseudoduganella sp. SL102]WBS00745.1 PilZ domain-containing protein [Pseudoduganella sp. SL102]
MTSILKNLRDHLPWLQSPAVRRSNAHLRPAWSAVPAAPSGVKEYVRTEAAGDLITAGLLPRRRRMGAADIAERIPLAATPHEIADPAAIRETLQTLYDRGEPITIYADGTGTPRLARIHAMDATEAVFTLRLDGESALPEGPCTFVTRLDSARFQFELSAGWTPLPGHATLVPAPFPQSCLVLNRRASRRLETPVAGNYTASFVMFGTPYEMLLYDVAAGGIGMRCAPRDAPGLHIGRRLQRVRLELNDTVVICDLEVRLSRRFRSFLLGEQVQIGCRFVGLSEQMQTLVDRAITKMAQGRR